MKRASLMGLALCLALPLAARHANAVELSFKLYVVAVPAAEATIRLDTTQSTYRMALAFHTTGIADVFAADRLEEHSSGRLVDDRPETSEYGSSGFLHGQQRSVTMIWHDGVPVITAIAPANNTDREGVSPVLLGHAVDPLDAIVLLQRQVARTGRCEGSSRAFDGRRLHLLEARTTGEEDLPPTGRSNYSGRALRCDFTDHTLAGYRLGSGRDDDFRDHHGTIWFGQVFPGAPRLPIRAAVQTRWLGEANLYLTSAVP